MPRIASTIEFLAIGLLTAAFAGCVGGGEPAPAAELPPARAVADPAGPKADFGVDLTTKTIRLGALNDESGPGATVGKPYAIGKRVLVAQVNAGRSGLLPEGWKLELVEEDHGSNPEKAVQAYDRIKDQVLFIATTFGTVSTRKLRPLLERDQMIALPASPSSGTDKRILLGAPSYTHAAMRGMDFVVAGAKNKSKLKPGIIYQQDDSGMDGLTGWKTAATYHGVAIVSEQTVTPGQKDFAPVIAALKSARATHVLLAVSPGATGPILEAAAQLQYKPHWIGSTSAWSDTFFNPEVISPAVFANFDWICTLRYWGEQVEGMDAFLTAYEHYGKNLGPPDMHILFSYIQGLRALKVLERAIDSNDLSRGGLLTVLFPREGVHDGDSVTSVKSRILRPDFEAKTWKVLADYARPEALGPDTSADSPANSRRSHTLRSISRVASPRASR